MHIHWLALVLVISFAVCEEDMHDSDSEQDDVEEEKYDEEDESIADFERYLADFVPHETYLFKIAPLAPQKIIVRAQPTSYAFRGLIHADYESEDRFLVNILKDGHISKNFENKRFCVFHIECLGANEFAFVIQSQR